MLPNFEQIQITHCFRFLTAVWKAQLSNLKSNIAEQVSNKTKQPIISHIMIPAFHREAIGNVPTVIRNVACATTVAAA